MESKLEFEDRRKKKYTTNKILLKIGEGLLSLTIFIVFYYVNDLFGKLFYYVYILLAILIIDIIRAIVLSKKKALSLSTHKIYNHYGNVQADWNEVQDIKYEIRMVSSFLKVYLKDEIAYIKKQKWYKRPRLYFNKWKFKTPLVVNLEKLDGETDENYKKIINFIKEYNLLILPQ